MKKRWWLLATLFLLIGTVALSQPHALDQQRARHAQMRARWKQQEPEHYRYVLNAQEYFWIDNPAWDAQVSVEVKQGQIVQIIDLATNQPISRERFFARGFLLIDDLFERIEAGLEAPSNPGELIARRYPNLKLQFSRMLWRANHKVNPRCDPDYGRGCFFHVSDYFWPDNHCNDPAFPEVEYNRQWGYPTHLRYRSNDCISMWIFGGNALIEISDFKSLP